MSTGEDSFWSMSLDDTIAAIASAPGPSKRGLIRVSGTRAVSIVESISAPGACAIDFRRGVIRYRLAMELACLLALYPAPHSYTGQDTIEIITVGNPTLLGVLLDQLVQHGARLAEPGEFTARAWMNGQLTLTQAEGVAAIIAARSDAQLRAGRMLTEGRFGSVVDELAQELAQLLALVEAGIDFTDQEDVVAIGPASLHDGIARLCAKIKGILKRSTARESLSHLPLVAIVGAPNAGKSTLLNALLGRERVVVSDVRGTTRDAIAQPMHLDASDPYSPEVLLVDLAGLDPSVEGLNPSMQAAALRTIDRADLVLHAVAPDVADVLPSELADDPRVIVVHSKSDLRAERRPDDELQISAKTGAGMENLRFVLAERLGELSSHLGADAMTLWPRHEQALGDALEFLCGAGARVEPHRVDRQLPEPELLAADLRSALDALGQLTGSITPDDVLGRVFASFCVGK